MKETARRSRRAKITLITPGYKTVKLGATVSTAAKKSNVKGPANGEEISETSETDYENSKAL